MFIVSFVVFSKAFDYFIIACAVQSAVGPLDEGVEWW